MGKNKKSYNKYHEEQMAKHEELITRVDEVLMDLYAVLDYTRNPDETQQALYELEDLLAKVYKRTYNAVKSESQLFSVRALARTPYPERPESYKRRMEDAEK